MANRFDLRACVVLATFCTVVGCNQTKDGLSQGSDSARPDTLPAMLNKDLPFRYPPALYADRAQGNVTLRLYVDKEGSVVNDSTKIVETSGVPMLDSAAIKGSRDLRFAPAKQNGAAMPVSILFPVYFRHPEAEPPAGDSLLKNGKAPVTAPK